MSQPWNMPNFENCFLAELETAAHCAPFLQSFVRMTAMRALLLGLAPEQVAQVFCITRRTLRSGVAQFNEAGIDGLIDPPRQGCPRKIPPEQSQQYRQLLEHPDLAGETHWTARKFHGYPCRPTRPT
jgi:transposase